MPKILLDRYCRYSAAVRVDLEDYFCQQWSQTMSGLHINRNCMLVDLLETDSVLGIFSRQFLSCFDLYCAVQKDNLTFGGLSVATFVRHIKL